MALKIIRLEERIVLEAAAAGALASDAMNAVDHVTDMCDPAGDAADCPNPSEGPAAEPHAPGDAQDAESDVGHGVHVLAVASTVDDAQALAGAAVQGVLTYVYDGHANDLDAILADIKDMLDGQKADSIAFATETGGAAGQFHITDLEAVNLESLTEDPGLVAFWKGVGDLMNEDGRIDILSCETGAGDHGAALVQALADITGRDIAASHDPTGSADLGGDWVLEQGQVDLTAVYFDSQALDDYHGVLGTAPILDPTYDHAMNSIAVNVTDSSGQQVSDFIDERAISDSDGWIESIAVTGADVSNGEWQYLDNGVWTSFGNVSTHNALLLHSDDYVRFVPDADYIGTATFEFHAWDERNFYDYTFDMEIPVTYSTTEWDLSTASSLEGARSIFSTSHSHDTQIDMIIPLDIYGEGSLSLYYHGTCFPNHDWLAILCNGNHNFITMYSVESWTQYSMNFSVDDSTVFILRYYNCEGDPTRGFFVDNIRIWNTPRYDIAIQTGGSTPYSTASDTVSIAVEDVNTPPVAVDDSLDATEDIPLTIAVDTDLLGNDYDINNHDLTLVSFTQAAHGMISDNGDGTLRYTPNRDFFGTDSFTYTISDGHEGESTATVTVTVAGANDAPTAVDDSYATDEDSLLSVAAPGILENDYDIDPGDTLTVYDYDTRSAYGATVSVDLATGAFTYDPRDSAELQALAQGETVIDTFTYLCLDQNGAWSPREATVEIEIAGVNDAPLAVGDALQTTENEALAGNLVANDVDVDHGAVLAMDSLTVAGSTYTFGPGATEFIVPLGKGTLYIRSNGDFLFDPGTGYDQLVSGESALETFTYTMRDENGVLSPIPATVILTVMGEVGETAPPYTPGGLYLGWAMHAGSSPGQGSGGQGGGGAGGSIQGHGEVLAQGLGLMNRDNPWGPAYPDRPFHIGTYLENSDAAKAAFNDAVDGLPGVSQITRVALKDFNADILDHLLGQDADVTLHDLQDLIHDLEQVVERMGPSEMAQFRGVLVVWLQSLKIQAAALAEAGEDVETLLDQLKALEEQITMTA